ncbi:MAG: DUF6597 domain-containing transcriptional factor [Gammaproteobacteria bacterium]
MRIHKHASELGRWRTVQRNAHPQLRAFVRGYLASSSVLPKAVREWRLPSLEVPLFLNFGAAHRQLGTAESQEWVSHDGIWVVGLHERHQLSEAFGERNYMIVRFTPLGAHHFLGIPMHLLTGHAIELEALDPKLTRLIMSRVGVARSWSDRFAAMEALIAERIAHAIVPGGLVWAWSKLEAADGRIVLESLLPDIGCSHRVFIARCRTRIGLTPKKVARLFRFNHVMQLLDGLSRNLNDGPVGKPYLESRAPADWRIPEPCWAGVATDCGYADQSHFIKEFRQFAGITPTEFLRRMSNAS